MFSFLLSHHILMLVYCFFSFHEFNFEMENFVKVNDEKETGKT